jgi:hypothetical protein
MSLLIPAVASFARFPPLGLCCDDCHSDSLGFVRAVSIYLRDILLTARPRVGLGSFAQFSSSAPCPVDRAIGCSSSIRTRLLPANDQAIIAGGRRTATIPSLMNAAPTSRNDPPDPIPARIDSFEIRCPGTIIRVAKDLGVQSPFCIRCAVFNIYSMNLLNSRPCHAFLGNQGPGTGAPIKNGGCSGTLGAIRGAPRRPGPPRRRRGGPTPSRRSPSPDSDRAGPVTRFPSDPRGAWERLFRCSASSSIWPRVLRRERRGAAGDA